MKILASGLIFFACVWAGLYAGVDEGEPILSIFDVTVVAGGGPNGALGPGESAALEISLQNDGASAHSVSATLSSKDPGVSVLFGESEWSDIAEGAHARNIRDFILALDPTLICSDMIQLSLEISFNESAQITLPLSLQLGQFTTVIFSEDTVQDIPESMFPFPGVLESHITISDTKALISDQFKLSLDITHQDVSDLRIFLDTPEGSSALIHDRTNAGSTELILTYPDDVEPTAAVITELEAIRGETLDGLWTLAILDNIDPGVGVLNSWSIQDQAILCDGDVCEGSNLEILTGEANLCFGISQQIIATLTSGGVGPYQWRWTPAQNLLDPDQHRPFARLKNATDFVVSVTDQNGCHHAGLVHVFITGGAQIAAWPQTDILQLITSQEQCALTL